MDKSRVNVMNQFDALPSDTARESFLLGYGMARFDSIIGHLPMILQEDRMDEAFQAGYDAFWTCE